MSVGFLNPTTLNLMFSVPAAHDDPPDEHHSVNLTTICVEFDVVLVAKSSVLALSELSSWKKVNKLASFTSRIT